MQTKKFLTVVFGEKSMAKIGHFEMLFVALLLALIIKPFFKGFVGIQILTNLLFTIVYIAAIFTVIQTPKIFRFSLAVVIPTVAVTWLSYLVPSYLLILGERILNLIFFAYTGALLLLYLSREEYITRNVIMCAMSTYLVMGFMWASAYILLESLYPGSFQLVHKNDPSGDLLYFSFVTITTLGYGDILPLTMKARALVVVETVLGQMYVAVMIARLVGIQIAQKMAEK